MTESPPHNDPASSQTWTKTEVVSAPSGSEPHRIPFVPVRCLEDENEAPPASKTALGRVIKYGTISLIFSVILYVLMEDPGGFFSGAPLSTQFTWSGLFVYTSIVALLLFLALLLIRFVLLLGLSFIHTAQRSFGQQREVANPPPVSIIVPAYNEGILLESTIASLVKLDYPTFEIIIVDDGSLDETRQIAQTLIGRHGPVEVKVVAKPNGGKSTALNAGIQCCQHDFVLCVDGDSQLSADTLRRAIVHFADPKVGAVAGNVKVMNRNKLWTDLQALEYVEGLNMVRSAQSLLQMVNIIPGPLGLFRKEAIVEAGWYSSKTFAEDCDITIKIIRNGWRVEYEPEAKSFTEAPDRLTDLLKQRYRWTRGILQVVRKHKDLFFNPFTNLRGTAVMWSMAFESLIWPVMNLFANLYFILVAVFFDLSVYLVFWWISLTLLDMISALYCVATEKEEVRLVFYSVFYRIFFILLIDVCKALATIEEFLGIGMTWGKLDRIGTSS